MIEFTDYSFRYEERDRPTLDEVCLKIRKGELILLTGRSGCGKTTLIRSLNGLIPHFYPGEIRGDLKLSGSSLMRQSPSALAGQIGTVFQDPRSQFFMTDTTRELAFGCENMGYLPEETVDRVRRAVKRLCLEPYLNRSIFALSSGEKQQVAIGSVYAMAPEVFIFDEPSANLDHDAARRLAGILRTLKEEGCTVIVAEHRFYYFRDLIDRVFWIQEGRIQKSFSREEFCHLDTQTRASYGLRTAYPEREISQQTREVKAVSGENVLEAKELSFFYEKERRILDRVSFTVRSGEIMGIVGHNGAGKTTLLSLLTGIKKEKSGELLFNGKRTTAKKRRALSYLVMQDADYQLFGSSVEEEMTLGSSDGESEDKVSHILKKLDLDKYRECHPASLSGGQKQRVTIAAALVKGSPILCFDEPTSGLDYDSMVRVSGLIRELAEEGAMVFVVSHDFEFILRTCSRQLSLDEDGGQGYAFEDGK